VEQSRDLAYRAGQLDSANGRDGCAAQQRIHRVFHARNKRAESITS
jgi:hypothetical protein